MPSAPPLPRADEKAMRRDGQLETIGDACCLVDLKPQSRLQVKLLGGAQRLLAQRLLGGMADASRVRLRIPPCCLQLRGALTPQIHRWTLPRPRSPFIEIVIPRSFVTALEIADSLNKLKFLIDNAVCAAPCPPPDSQRGTSPKPRRPRPEHSRLYAVPTMITTRT
jgi:hypothetical protein